MEPRKSKSLFLLKSCEEELRDLAAKKKSETKSFYVVRTNDEIVNKYGDIVYDFVDKPSVFLLITPDKGFYQVFKSAICQALGIDPVFIQVVADVGRAADLLAFFTEKGITPFVFMEYSLNAELTLSFMRYIRAAYEDTKVVILSRELSRDRLFQFFEDGADSFLQKPTSINSIISKIAFMVQPQSEADALVEEAREHVKCNRFEEALVVAEEVLGKWPKNAAAMVVYGDAKNGLALREEALSAYTKAERNSNHYLEPLQRIVKIHTEDGNFHGVLKYLKKLDTLSPLNCTRKIKIGEIHFSQGDQGTAQEYFDNAITSAKEEALAVVGEMTLDIAEMVAKHDPKLAIKYYRKSLDFVKSSKNQMAMTVYNRLGISLRKQGMWAESVEAYAEAASFAPNDENIQYNMGLAYAEGESFAKSATCMVNAMVINQDIYKGKAELSYQFSSIFVKARMTREATIALTYLKEISPGYKDSEELLAKVAGTGDAVGKAVASTESGYDLRF